MPERKRGSKRRARIDVNGIPPAIVSPTRADVDFAKDISTITGRGQGTKNHEARVIVMTDALRSVLLRLKAERNPASSDSLSLVHDAKKCLATATRRLGYLRREQQENGHVHSDACRF